MGLEALRGIMTRKGFTSEKLAESTGIPKSTIDKIAGGSTDNPRYKTLKSIIDGLNLSLDELLIVLDGMSVSEADREMLTMFHSLNSNGKELVRRFVQDVAENRSYRERGAYFMRERFPYANPAAAMEGKLAKAERTDDEIQEIERAGKKFFDAPESDL